MEIKITNLNKSFNQRNLFYIDKLSFKSGNIYAVVGANGCGKSTLLRIISSIDYDYTGNIEFYNNNIVIENSKDIITYIHQKPYMFDFTVRENIEMAQKLCGNLKPVVDSEDLIKRFSINNILDSSAKFISGGEAQKVSFIRGLNQNAEIILLDEPTSSMDAESSEILEDILLEVRKNRIIVIVTHNIFQALRVGDYIINFSNGKVKCMEKEEALKSNSIKKLIGFVGNVNV